MFFVTLVLVSPRYVFSLLEPLKYVWPAPAAVYGRFARCQSKCPHLSQSMEKSILLTMQWIPYTHCSQKYISKGCKSDKHDPQGQKEAQQLNYPYPLWTGEPTLV